MRRPETNDASARTSAFASEADVRSAYRLLLGRAPDAEGLEHHRRMLAGRPMLVEELVRTFLGSGEFAARTGSLPIEVRLDGFSIFVRPEDRHIGAGIHVTGKYEPHVTAAVREFLRPGAVFVDVGANIGFFTNLAAHLVGPSGQVVAVEPMDKNLQLIYRALEVNHFEHVRVHACAASDREQIVAVATGTGTSNGQVIAASRADPSVMRSQTRRLDDLIANLDRIDLVKFDIEGYELFAWRGFRESLRRHRPVVLTEFHPWCMRTHVAIEPRDYLDELFSFADHLHVLAPDSTRTTCANADAVMRQWELADKVARSDGTHHLDLLVQPDR